MASVMWSGTFCLQSINPAKIPFTLIINLNHLGKNFLDKPTPRVVPSMSNKPTKNPTPVTINKAPPLPPLPVKTKK